MDAREKRRNFRALVRVILRENFWQLEVEDMINVALAPTLLDLYFPRLNQRVRAALLVVGGSLLVALMAQVSILLPFTPVPLTGQTFAVLLVGAVLGARYGALSLLLYLVEGAVGLPVFAGGTAGLVRLFGPTGGYLVGFVAAAFVVGLLAERGKDRRFGTAIVTFMAGEVVIYLFGLPWLAIFVGFAKTLSAGFFPFLIGDAIKVIAAASALPAAWKIVGFLRGFQNRWGTVFPSQEE